MRTGRRSIIFFILLISFTGCIKEKFDPSDFDASLDLTPGLAIPIGFSHLGVEKYLADSTLNDIIRISNDGFVSIYYTAEIDSGVMEDIFSINDASVNQAIVNQTGSDIFLNIPGITFDLADSIRIPVIATQADARIDSITLLSGTLQLNLTSVNLTGTITFKIDGLIQNGVPFTVTRDLADPDFTISLAGYTIIPEHDIAGNNLLKCEMAINLQSPSGPVNPGGTIVDIRADLSGMDYETIYGDFGGYTIDFPAQTIATPFFSKMTDGEILFADPEIKLFFQNSAGVPFGIYFSRIDAIDGNNAGYPLTGPGIPSAASPKIIAYPALNQEGQTISDSLVIDSNNSNLSEFLSTTPDSITINASAEITSLTPSSTSFINHDSKYKVSAAIELPLWGKADFLILLDTIEFDDLSSAIPPPEEVDRLIVRTSIINSFPVTVYPQIYLLDENYVMLDSLFTGLEKIEGATDTNGDGIADPHKQPPIDIDLPRSRIDNLLNARFLLAKGRIMTTDYPALDVKLYSSYYLDYYVGVIAQLKINTGQ
ncbi:MAG TPA: hypothetical protein DF818_11155 [Bacteroidales bacterium]|nr:hypothetical protein [Bacteroidales bacterium]